MVDLIANRRMNYATRRLLPDDEFTVDSKLDARILVGLRKARLAPEKKIARRPQLDHDNNGHEGGSRTAAGDDLTPLRAEYFAKLGKRPFNGWDADTLREKIAAA